MFNLYVPGAHGAEFSQADNSTTETTHSHPETTPILTVTLCLLGALLLAAGLFSLGFITKCCKHKGTKKSRNPKETSISVYSISSALQTTERSPVDKVAPIGLGESSTDDITVTSHPVVDKSTNERRKSSKTGNFGIGASFGSLTSITRSNASLDMVVSDTEVLVKSESMESILSTGSKAGYTLKSETETADDLTGVENEDFFFSDDLLDFISTQSTTDPEETDTPPAEKPESHLADIDSAPKKSLSETLQTSVMARMLLKRPGDKPKTKRLYKKNPEANVTLMTHKAAQRWTALQIAYDELLREDITPLKIV